MWRVCNDTVINSTQLIFPWIISTNIYFTYYEQIWTFCCRRRQQRLRIIGFAYLYFCLRFSIALLHDEMLEVSGRRGHSRVLTFVLFSRTVSLFPLLLARSRDLHYTCGAQHTVPMTTFSLTLALMIMCGNFQLARHQGSPSEFACTIDGIKYAWYVKSATRKHAVLATIWRQVFGARTKTNFTRWRLARYWLSAQV